MGRDRIIPYYFYLKIKNRLLKKIKPNLIKQFNSNKPLGNVFEGGPRILIPIIETSHYTIYLLLIIAKALQLRGANVKFLYCDKTLTACERIDTHNEDTDVCRECQINQTHLLPIYGVDVVPLSKYISSDRVKSINENAHKICTKFPDSYYYYDIDLMPMVNDSVTRFHFGADAESQEKLLELQAKNLATAMINLEIAKKIDQTFSPDIILSTMYVYTPWQPYFDYFRKNNVKTMAVETTAENVNAVRVSPFDLYLNNDRFNNYLKSRKTKALNDNERNEINRYMAQRFAGDTDFFNSRKMFVHDDGITDQLKIDNDKRNVFLFANVFWDIAVTREHSLYSGVIEWVLATIEMLKDKPDCHLYIKPHPCERFDSTVSVKSVSDHINEKYPNLPSNVTVIDPELKVVTYKLFDYIDLGVVFSGTLGIEMIASEIPVAAVGKSPYSGLELCYHPRTEQEYENMLMGKIENEIEPNKELIELFCYFYFIKRFIPLNIIKPVYSNTNFERYNFDSLEDLLPGKDYYLDHICNCILDPENTVVEGWLDNSDTNINLSNKNCN